MNGQQRTSRFLAALLVMPVLVLAGCKEEKQADQRPAQDQQQAAPAQTQAAAAPETQAPPPAPTQPAAAETKAKHAPKMQVILDQLKAIDTKRKPFDQPELVIPLDSAGHPTPVPTLDKSEEPRFLIGKEYGSLTPDFSPWSPRSHSDRTRVRLAKDVTGSVAPNGGIWHSTSPASGGSGGSISYSNKGQTIDLDEPPGFSRYVDGDSGNTITKGGNGVTIIQFPDDSPNLYATENPDGSYDLHERNGPTYHISEDGLNDYTDWGNGKRTYENQDGSERTIDLNDGSQNISDEKNGMYIDIPPLGGTPPADKPAAGTGEPHYLTRDGMPITTQAAGEFVLVTGVPGHTIQVRQQPWQDGDNISETASAITAMAFDAGGAKIEVRESGEVLYNGTPAGNDDFQQAELPQGGAVGVWRKQGTLKSVVLVWPDLSTITITNYHHYLNFVLQWAKLEPDHRGLLGSNDNNPANDLTDREGKVQPADADGAAAFVESWRLRDEESLFTYAPGQSTATFTLHDFPRAKPQIDTSAVTGLDALKPGPYRDFAAYDIALTGDRQFLDGYVETEHLAAVAQGRAVTATSSDKQAPTSSAAAITLSDDEKNAAQVMPPDVQVPVLKIGEAQDSLVFKLSLTEARTHKVVVYSNDKGGGYAFFTADGQIIGQPYASASGDQDVALPAGTVYFKVTGASKVVDVTLK